MGPTQRPVHDGYHLHLEDEMTADDPNDARAAAIAVLARHGWTEGDLDYLIYEAQAEDPGEGDPDFDAAVALLLKLRKERARRVSGRGATLRTSEPVGFAA